MRHFGGVFTFRDDGGPRWLSLWRAQRAIFSKILALWCLKTPKFSGLRGPWAAHGQVLSLSGAKSMPRFLTSGVLNAGPRVYG